MSALNLCQFIGNVGADPEIRTFQDGGRVANLRIAVTERFTARDGQPKETTEWISLVANGKTVDVVANYVRKGTSLYVQGKLHTREWTDQSGAKRYATEIQVFNLQLLGPKPANAAPAQPGYPPQGGYAQPPQGYAPPAPGYPAAPPQPQYQQPAYQPQGAAPAYPPQGGMPTPPPAVPQPGQPGNQQYPPMNDPAYTTPQPDDLPPGF